MKHTLIITLFISIIVLGSCKKAVEEASITFDTDAAAANITPANNFNFKVNLTSVMPAQGIKIEISAAEEISTTSITPQPPSITTSTNSNATSVINLPQQKWVVTTVKVTSVATPTNTLSKTFRVVFK